MLDDVAWTGGTMCLQSGSRLQVAGKLDAGADAGTFNCGSGDSLVDILSTGEVAVAGGPRDWFSTIRNAGLVTIDANEQITFHGGLQNVTGGTLTGNGTAADSIANSGGLVSPDGGTLFFNCQTPGVTFAVWGPFPNASAARRGQMSVAAPPAALAPFISGELREAANRHRLSVLQAAAFQRLGVPIL